MGELVAVLAYEVALSHVSTVIRRAIERAELAGFQGEQMDLEMILAEVNRLELDQKPRRSPRRGRSRRRSAATSE